MQEIVIQDKDRVENIKSVMKKAGVENLHILSDFDKTLIRAFVNGQSVPSTLFVLYSQNCLEGDYGKKAQELHKKYYAIEIDPKVPKEEKKKAMKEWWTLHFDLLIRSGLNKKDIQTTADSEKIKFREGFSEFADFLKEHEIPLVIMSSSGLGKDSIRMCLEKEKRAYENIHIISNSFQWDKDGQAVAVKEPIIYGMNKDETMIQSFPEIFEQVKSRKNVILLGDSLDDVDMVKGFDYENLIKIGFLNDNIQDNIEYYKKNYDIVILNDGKMDYITDLLKEIA